MEKFLSDKTGSILESLLKSHQARIVAEGTMYDRPVIYSIVKPPIAIVSSIWNWDKSVGTYISYRAIGRPRDIKKFERMYKSLEIA